jgi:hypothetical protein
VVERGFVAAEDSVAGSFAVVNGVEPFQEGIPYIEDA